MVVVVEEDDGEGATPALTAPPGQSRATLAESSQFAEDTTAVYKDILVKSLARQIACKFQCRLHYLKFGRLPLPPHFRLQSARTHNSPLDSCCWPSVSRPSKLHVELLLTQRSPRPHYNLRPEYAQPSDSIRALYLQRVDRSLVNLPVLGVPASLAFGYVAYRAPCRRRANNEQLWRSLHDLRSRCLRLISFFLHSALGLTLCTIHTNSIPSSDLTYLISIRRVSPYFHPSIIPQQHTIHLIRDGRGRTINLDCCV